MNEVGARPAYSGISVVTDLWCLFQRRVWDICKQEPEVHIWPQKRRE